MGRKEGIKKCRPHDSVHVGVHDPTLRKNNAATWRWECDGVELRILHYLGFDLNNGYGFKSKSGLSYE